MAQAQTAPFSGWIITLEDPEVPGTFVAPCGFTERAMTLSAETNDTNVPDCSDEDAPGWVERDVVSFSASLSGDGVLALDSYETWDEFFFSGKPRLARAVLRKRNVDGTYTVRKSYEGAFILTSLERGATKGEKVTQSVEMQSTGPVTPITPAP